jgi:hypothetical protein
MDSGAAVTRAFLTAGVWAGVSYALAMVAGVPADMMAVLTDGASMGAASLTSDTLHSTLGMPPTGITAAVGTGASFAAIQSFLRGDNNYAVNFASGAASDMLVEKVAMSSGM